MTTDENTTRLPFDQTSEYLALATEYQRQIDMLNASVILPVTNDDMIRYSRERHDLAKQFQRDVEDLKRAKANADG